MKIAHYGFISRAGDVFFRIVNDSEIGIYTIGLDNAFSSKEIITTGSRAGFFLDHFLRNTNRVISVEELFALTKDGKEEHPKSSPYGFRDFMRSRMLHSIAGSVHYKLGIGMKKSLCYTLDETREGFVLRTLNPHPEYVKKLFEFDDRLSCTHPLRQDARAESVFTQVFYSHSLDDSSL